MYKWLRQRVPGARRYGRRKLILLHCGAVWLITGWAILAAPPLHRFSHPGGIMEILDNPQWGLLWVVGGTLAIANGIFRRSAHGRDVVGFIGVVTPPALQLVFYILSAIAHIYSTYINSTHGESGNPRAGLGVLTWYLIWAFVLIVAGWPDPDDPDIAHPDDEGREDET
jgi:hypothetical protein